MQDAARLNFESAPSLWRKKMIIVAIVLRTGKRGSARSGGGGGSASAEELFAILVRQGFCCPYTGEGLEPDETTHLDHKVPVSRGGSDCASNLQWLSRRANMAKTDMTHDEFVGMCARVSSTFARQQEITFSEF